MGHDEDGPHQVCGHWQTRLRLGYSIAFLSTISKNYLSTVFAAHFAASQQGFYLSCPPTTSSIQHKDCYLNAVQTANITRGPRIGPLSRCSRCIQNLHREACRGCFAAPDCRPSLPRCRLWQKGYRFYDRAPALPSARHGRRACQDGG
jgi:hypothetical protein